MERRDRPLVTLFWGEPFASGEPVRLTGDPAQHARVRRVARDDLVRLVNGLGRVATGRIQTLAKNEVTVSIERVVDVPRPASLEVIVPVADRDRMLQAAEKCVELQVTSWKPAYFARSRSVSPRGEGEKFREKVRARMQAALEQCGGAWMPEINEETEAAAALQSVPRDWNRLLLDERGRPLAGLATSAPTAIAVGPEGGFEDREIATAAASGWVSASLGETTLRFETAVIISAAVIRATQLTQRGK